MRWISPEGTTVDAMLGFAVGGGAAFLAIALNRVPQALEDASRIAFAAGVANGVMLPMAIMVCMSGVPQSSIANNLVSDANWAFAAVIGLAIVLSVLVTPWACYVTLRLRRVRYWFGAVERNRGSGGFWVNEA